MKKTKKQNFINHSIMKGMEHSSLEVYQTKDNNQNQNSKLIDEISEQYIIFLIYLNMNLKIYLKKIKIKDHQVPIVYQSSLYNVAKIY